MKCATRVLTQGNPEWLDWCNQGITSFEAPMVMGQSAQSTQLELFFRKIGKLPNSIDSWALKNAQQYEPYVRELYTNITGIETSPICVEHPTYNFLRASLDGISPPVDDDVILISIKNPPADDHKLALAGKLPTKYLPDLQHQLMCVDEATRVDFVSYNEGFAEDFKVAIVPVYHDLEFIKEMRSAEIKFWWHVANQVPPTNDNWDDAAKFWLEAHKTLKIAKEDEKKARENLLALFPSGVKYHQGGGVSATKYNSKGDVEWEKLLAAHSIDPEEKENFRGKPKGAVRLTADKESMPNIN